jgi:hypothetical protein
MDISLFVYGNEFCDRSNKYFNSTNNNGGVMDNKRTVGNILEELVVSYIKKIDPKARRTKNSGASSELEDVLSSKFIVQCKVDNSHNNIIIQKKDWDKLIFALPIDSKRIPIFVNRQKDGLITVTLTIDDYFNNLEIK